ncbi:c-type cytochrome biogenesis protein CcmI [Gilvimarinus xylanilyticus]|uniref:C-type cytochrome biogenesis protein CcmI n=1 Tax=Gilvimarinus xylanilyticus TaxID=2944139 RepID=A0A9X2I3T0_9GAMM|nr:c-type cytochrome biogenesis protein CcmI [Gilvimarinus xylanilyticus]MCP8898427.1 c-type cytochrome biogenesis protein CcmI [Gilvimarinus xylanilyticus]
MNVFLIGALVLTLVATLCVVWPLFVRKSYSTSRDDRLQENIALYREHERELQRSHEAGDIDAAQLEKLTLELKANLLADQQVHTARYQSGGKALLAVMALAVCLGSVWLYFAQGASGDVAFTQLQRKVLEDNFTAMQAGERPDAAKTRELVDRLQERVKVQPDNAQYWYLLGNYASQLGEYPLAIEGYRKVYELAPNEPGSASELAQALFLGADNQITEEVAFLTDKALQVDPDDTTALGLAGIRAFGAQDYANAVRYWQSAADLTPPGASGRRALLAGVERARAELEKGGAAQSEASADASWQLPVTVTLADDLAIPDGATLFVFVRQHQGSPMPLAVYRTPARQLPLSVTLDESMAMTTADRLYNAGALELVARLSNSGQAMPQSGDMEGRVGPLDAEDLAGELNVEIDTVRP